MTNRSTGEVPNMIKTVEEIDWVAIRNLTVEQRTR
jgi:hypothetical protein